MIRFRCPECETPMEVDESFAGRPARCPTCGQTLRVPKADLSPSPSPRVLEEPSGPGVVRFHGESVEIRPPVEPMAVVSLVLAILAVGTVLFLGFDPIGLSYSPWTVGFLVGALVAFLAAVFGMAAYHSIRRSRGRAGGRSLALIGTLGGLGLFIVLGAGAAVCSIRVMLQPTCEDNLRVLYQGLKGYADAHEGKLPANLRTLVTDRYIDADHWLTCPAFRAAPGTQTYRLMPDINLHDPLYPPDMMIVADAENAHPDGALRVLLKDGSVRTVPGDQWTVYYADQQKKYGEIVKQLRLRATGTAPGAPAPAPAPAPENVETAP